MLPLVALIDNHVALDGLIERLQLMLDEMLKESLLPLDGANIILETSALSEGGLGVVVVVLVSFLHDHNSNAIIAAVNVLISSFKIEVLVVLNCR